MLDGLRQAIRYGLDYVSLCLAFQVPRSERKTLWDQLILAALEDIGPADPLALYHVINHDDDDLSLATIVVYLSQSPKTQINKMAKWNRDYHYQPDIAVHEALTSHLKNITPLTLNMSRFAITILWASKLHHPIRKETGFRRKAPILIWRTFDEIFKDDSYYQVIRQYFLEGYSWPWSDKRNILVHFHLLHIYYTGRPVRLVVLKKEILLRPIIDNLTVCPIPPMVTDWIVDEDHRWDALRQQYRGEPKSA